MLSKSLFSFLLTDSKNTPCMAPAVPADFYIFELSINLVLETYLPWIERREMRVWLLLGSTLSRRFYKKVYEGYC